MSETWQPQKARAAYEADVALNPYYHDGSPRKSWNELDEIAQISWGRPAPPPDDLQREPPADDAADEIERLRTRVESLEADKARLGAALEFYADTRNWQLPRKYGHATTKFTEAEIDGGSRARATLDAMKGGGDDG